VVKQMIPLPSAGKSEVVAASPLSISTKEMCTGGKALKKTSFSDHDYPLYISFPRIRRLVARAL
jgi:hypothetical protein